MFNKSQSPNGRPHHLPEVAETPPVDPATCPEEFTSRLTDEAAFKVFLKRNMRHEAPPADLLGDIRARISKIRAEK